jgi:hypothetical protein
MEQSACRGTAKPKMAEECCRHPFGIVRKHTGARKTRVAIRIGEANISGNENVVIIRTPRRQNQRAKS